MVRKYVKCKGWFTRATKMQAQVNDFPFHLLRRFCVYTYVAVVDQCICLFACVCICICVCNCVVRVNLAYHYSLNES